MLVIEFKARTNTAQESAINEAIRTAQFVQNKALRMWMDVKGTSKFDLSSFYPRERIKRVRIVRRADGFYVQFCVKLERVEPLPATGNVIGLDVGLADFYTDSNGHKEPIQRFLRKSEQQRKKLNRRFSKTKRGSQNRQKARKRLARLDLRISRQRKDHAVKLARCVAQSNDLIAYEDLRIKNMVKNHCLAKSISDAGWYQFRP